MEKIKKSLRDYPFMRWIVLFLASAVMFMNYYFYDALSPLKDLMTINLGFSSSEYGAFMSAYSVPNVFLAMAVIGGIILDKLGIRITGFTFIFLMAVGSGITAYGASESYLSGGIGYNFMNSFLTQYSPALKMMYLGFFIFGLGAETSIVALTKVVVKWFKGKELALALGLNLAIGRLGTALVLILSPKLIFPEWTNAIWFGVMLLWIGLIIFIIYIFLDLKLDRQEKISTDDPEDEFKWSDLRFLVTNRSFIFITLLCVTFYSAVFPFVKFAPDMLMNKFNLQREIAGNVSSYLMFGTILLTPLFGWIADNKGRSATLMYLGSALLIIAHLLFAKTLVEPRIPIFILGVAFSLVPAAMWPAVTKIVGENKLGTAYGFMFSVQNIGLWAMPILIGSVLDSSNPGYIQQLKPSEFEAMQTSGFAYSGTVLNSKQEQMANSDLKITVVAHQDSMKGEVVWREKHSVKTDQQGDFDINIGEGDILLTVDLRQLVDTVDYKAQLLIYEKKDTLEVYQGDFAFNEEDFIFHDQLSNYADEYSDKHVKGKLAVATADGEKVLEKGIKFHIDENGEFEVPLMQGEYLSANKKYFGFNSKQYYIEVIKPLDYTNPMLIFAALGILGLLFAFFLKRDDKTSGYGLELPNKND
ncbi:MAG: MFS transporter [Bacteroidales bacterium]